MTSQSAPYSTVQLIKSILPIFSQHLRINRRASVQRVPDGNRGTDAPHGLKPTTHRPGVIDTFPRKVCIGRLIGVLAHVAPAPGVARETKKA